MEGRTRSCLHSPAGAQVLVSVVRRGAAEKMLLPQCSFVKGTGGM